LSGNDKNKSGSGKTSDGIVGDPSFCATPHPNSTAERLDENFIQFQPLTKWKRNMAYLTAVAIMSFVVSLDIAGAHS
jgi:hypothetical protein